MDAVFLSGGQLMEGVCDMVGFEILTSMVAMKVEIKSLTYDKL